jgi:hypothetical protein
MTEDSQAHIDHMDPDVDGPDEGSDGPQNTSNLTIRRAVSATYNHKQPCPSLCLQTNAYS